jgi:DNA-binding transcriptional LysR family regulator
MSDLIAALRTFARLSEKLSFSAVATETNASHTTIARRIDFLEQHFGVRVLVRSTRRLTLTDEGERLLEHARAVLDELEQAETDLSPGRTQARGVVRVGVTTALGLHYAERVGVLYARHPELRVEFAVADWQRDMQQEGLDLALRVGERAEDALIARPLGLVHRILVAAPAYLQAMGRPARPEQLPAHQCVVYGYGPTPVFWEVGGVSYPVAGFFKADSSEAVRRAVLSGLGVALLPHLLVAEDLAAGRLEQLLQGVEIEPLRLAVVRPATGRVPPRVRVVLDFLVQQFPTAEP